MPDKKQDNILVEFTVDDNAPDKVKEDNPNRTIEMKGHVASAFRELHAAEHFGVHKSRIQIDALARFDQLSIPFRNFYGHGDTGTTRGWIALMLPRFVQARIVAEEVA